MVRFSSCDFHSIVEGDRERDTGERGKNYKTLRDISQSKKKNKRGGSQQKQGGNRD